MTSVHIAFSALPSPCLGASASATARRDLERNLIGCVVRQAPSHLRSSVKKRLVQVLTVSDSRSMAYEIHKMVRQAQRDRDFADTMLRAWTATEALYGMSLSPCDLTAKEDENGC